jgi:hypothetical protein
MNTVIPSGAACVPGLSRHELSAERTAFAGALERSRNVYAMLAGEPMVRHAAIMSDLFATLVYVRTVRIHKRLGHDASLSQRDCPSPSVSLIMTACTRVGGIHADNFTSAQHAALDVRRLCLNVQDPGPARCCRGLARGGEVRQLQPSALPVIRPRPSVYRCESHTDSQPKCAHSARRVAGRHGGSFLR